LLCIHSRAPASKRGLSPLPTSGPSLSRPAASPAGIGSCCSLFGMWTGTILESGTLSSTATGRPGKYFCQGGLRLRPPFALPGIHQMLDTLDPSCRLPGNRTVSKRSRSFPGTLGRINSLKTVHLALFSPCIYRVRLMACCSCHVLYLVYRDVWSTLHKTISLCPRPSDKCRAVKPPSDRRAFNSRPIGAPAHPATKATTTYVSLRRLTLGPLGTRFSFPTSLALREPPQRLVVQPPPASGPSWRVADELECR
jgi:hypothetical protein